MRAKLLLYGAHDAPDGIDFLLFKVSLATRRTHAYRSCIDRNVTTTAVCMKGSMAFFHFTPAMDTFHFTRPRIFGLIGLR